MSAPGIFTLPEPKNEPVRDYAPGSPEREELRGRLEEMLVLDDELADERAFAAVLLADRARLRFRHLRAVSTIAP